jgi:hypothetical protein
MKINKIKLELKHLAPYLPYGLNAKASDDNTIRTVTLLHCTYDTKTVGLKHLLHGGTFLKKHKPILRPLSDLNTEFEGNEHSINALIEKKYGLDYGIFSHYKGFLNIELDGDPLLRYDSNKCLDFKVIFEIQEHLFKHHFDVFGLIEKGLAINVNDL